MPSPKVPTPSLYLDMGRGRRLVRIGTADGRPVEVPASFAAVFDVPGVGVVTLTVEAEEGRARITDIGVSEVDGRGVAGVTVASVPVAKLLEAATSKMAFLSGAGAARAGVRTTASAATRRRVSDDRLRNVADAHARGGVAEVMTSEHVGERQAYRLIDRARAAGLIAEDDDR